ncbi:smad nuclear-interacting protein 1 [Coccinella septempunctata]|uniref:smad nuclear-interacting protein 1 n=1 Tax=Coccinella septempunctata TaxID=41139 RepID=UPI001D08ECC6|nr:smad nuclear-interacting protein 1 [Coccinella septempunctata]
MSSSKSRKRRSDSSSSSKSSSDSDSSLSSKEYKKRKHSVNSSGDSENERKSKVRKQQKEKLEDQHGSKHERSDKHKREHRENKGVDSKRNETKIERGKNQKYRRSYERDDRHRNDNRSDDRRKNEYGRERGRNERDRNDFGTRRRSPGRFRGSRNRRSRSKSFDHANAKWGKEDQKNSNEKPTGEKQKPNFGLSGKLTEETNTYRGVVIKYSEPPEARKPKRRWRLYPFKGEKALQTLYIHRESAYLIGRDRKVVDLPVDHPSCSKQHAALQYRLVPFTRDDGSVGKRVRPYLIDLESANGTFINNKKIESKKYVELLEKDVIKFGFSSREYVLLHENSKDEAQDDDVKLEEEEVTVKKEEQDA